MAAAKTGWTIHHHQIDALHCTRAFHRRIQRAAVEQVHAPPRRTGGEFRKERADHISFVQDGH